MPEFAIRGRKAHIGWRARVAGGWLKAKRDSVAMLCDRDGRIKGLKDDHHYLVMGIRQ